MDMPVPVIPAARFKDHISHTHARCSQHLQIAGSIKILTKRVDPPISNTEAGPNALFISSLFNIHTSNRNS